MGRHDDVGSDPVKQRILAIPLRQEAPQPKATRAIDRKSFLGKYLEDVLAWRRHVIKIDAGIIKEPFPDDELVFNKTACHAGLLNDMHAAAEKHHKAVSEAHLYLKNDTIPTLNNGVQPFIVTVYGPTGSGKSQFIRNILAGQLIEPIPHTVFFITPEAGTVSVEERLAWEAQCVEGNYNTDIAPLSGTFKPKFITLTFREAISDENLNIDNHNNIFKKAAMNGPVCIIMDECMNQLGSSHSISSFFHALPSKILGRFPKCTGYTVIVVLHNMNPRHDRGNIKDLKIQAKCHVISPQLDSGQITRFIRNYSFGFPSSLIPILKDIVDHARINSKYSWLVYNNVPICEAFRWAYYSPDEQLRPIFMNIQSLFYNSCQEIRRIFRKRTYSQMQYIKKLNQEYFY
ncbi:IVa2 [Duck adenovirus 1]|uniref:IVa2 n=1 Tax=Duck adenovirus 1 TaxID=130329 RepID=S5RYQ2_DADV1|nr:IVa2 [Duck adenovirus 1]WPT09536.1 IVa2 [Duck adenovirus 1]